MDAKEIYQGVLNGVKIKGLRAALFGRQHDIIGILMLTL